MHCISVCIFASRILRQVVTPSHPLGCKILDEKGLINGIFLISISFAGD